MAGLMPFNNRVGLYSKGFEDFYNMLDDYFSDNITRRSSWYGTFKLDIHQNDKEYKIEADLPGVKKEEIDIEFIEGRLTIGVKREESKEEQKKNYLHKERHYRSMERSIYLADAQADGITAKLENGVLTVTVPKEPKSERGRYIEIE